MCFFISRKCPLDHAGGSTRQEGGFFSPLKHTQQLLYVPFFYSMKFGVDPLGAAPSTPRTAGSGGAIGYVFVTTETYVTTLISDLLELELIT